MLVVSRRKGEKIIVKVGDVDVIITLVRQSEMGQTRIGSE